MGNIVPMIGLAVFLGIYVHFQGDVFDPKTVAGTRVLITGASSGIGEQLAYHYSRLGARVFITARRAKLLAGVAEHCRNLGAQQVEFVTSDLAQQPDRDRVVAEAVRRLGGLDHLILNHAIASAGLWLGTKGNVSSLVNDLNVNFVSYVDLASQALPLLTTSKGSIGVVSSVAGKIPIAALGSYSSDKFALQAFFAALRVELQLRDTGVSVTTCVIGPVDTNITGSEEGKKRLRENSFFGLDVMATPQDTANAIVVGVATRQKEIYYGRVAWILVTLHQMFPGFIENRIGAAPVLSRLQ